jgi:hypothetical protein
MASGIIQMHKVALLWIPIGNLGKFLLQTVQNDVHKLRLIKPFSWQQRDDIGDSDGNKTHPKHDRFCTDKLFGASWASYFNGYPNCGLKILKVRPRFIAMMKRARSVA